MSSSDDLRYKLDEWGTLARDLDLNEENTFSSSSFVSSDSSDSEEEGEEVNQLVLNRKRGANNPWAKKNPSWLPIL